MVDAAPRSVSVHWDLENVAVPRGASTIQVVHRIREAVMGEMGEIQAFYAYLDVAKAPARLRQELAMAGLDLIDCSSTCGKPGQVDLRIIARALRSPPAEGVVIISGDSDFAYVISQLRSARRRTALVYDANNTAAVSTALLEVAHVTLAVSFSGEPPAAAAAAADSSNDPEEIAAEYLVLPATSSAPVVPERVQRQHFLDALGRSPEAEPGGWRAGPNVGELFRRLSQGDKHVFRAAKKALLDAGRVERHPDGRDLMRVTPPPAAA